MPGPYIVEYTCGCTFEQANHQDPLGQCPTHGTPYAGSMRSGQRA